ncbi:endonuclease/exonuclease/phosphatase family protein [Sinorhizobium sojae]|nr:endonuclease/exonuclease/phosphatase family protein [Sinorhizobium sojae]
MARWAVIGLGSLGVAATVVPFIPSDEWWIRIWDFPRIQVAVLLAVMLGAVPFSLPIRRRRTAAFAVALTVALGWQIFAILPYTPIVATEAKAAENCDQRSRIRLLVANVLKSNRNAEPLLSLLDRLRPDILVLVETDAWWDTQLAPLKESYPYGVAYPQENGYGMHLFSRFELIGPEVRFLIDDYVPSIKTGLLLPSGARIDLYGLHPKPPPLQDTARRDAELMIVGREVRMETAPAIVAGDLNDVAWSRTNSLFQEISGLLDPRIGRGPYATFNANWPFLRWPLDHVFFEDSFQLLHLAVAGNIGSDHFPFFVALCHRPAAEAEQEQPRPEPSDVEAADEAIEKGREEETD